MAAIRLHASQGDAIMVEQDVYGDRFVLAGKLIGPKGEMSIESVWIRRTGESPIRFVTLKPAREAS